MNKIILNFLKDKLSITLVYFINTFLIILFFYLYIEKSIPLIYPILLSTFVYIIFLAFEFYKYYGFNESIRGLTNNFENDICAKTYEQMEIRDAIYKMRQEYAKSINSMKEENRISHKFFSQWVHNMKTPVSVIEIIVQKIMAKLGAKTFVEEDELVSVLNLTEELREENNKILKGLDQILNMIRIEDFSKDYVPEAVNLYDSLKKVINERKSQFIHNNVFPKIICDCNDEKVLTDRKWNELVIGQIISNAIKYSRSSEEEKEVGKFIFFNIKQEEKFVILTIKDEGIGIPSYDINRVFEAFFTGENGRKYSYSTGIGLYICKVICERLGQDISIESDLHNGTEVKIRYLSKL